MYTPNDQITNPTDEQRHEMLRTALENTGRPDDYDYIIDAMSTPPDITCLATPGLLKGIKIGIIGGGLAGMSAAFELRKLGADISIFESCKDRIGGRVYTCYLDAKCRHYGEFGAARIPISHETTWHYINLFGLNTISLTSPSRNNFLYVHNTRLRTNQPVDKFLYSKYDLTDNERHTPWPQLSSYALEQSFLKLSPDIRSELIRILHEYSPEILPLMNMSLRQNYENLGLSQGAINLISSIEPNNGALLHISYDEIANEVYTLDYRNTYSIVGGIAILPYAIYNSFYLEYPQQYKYIDKTLLGKVDFKPGHHVTGIYQSSYRNKIVIKYSNTIKNWEKAEIFDYIICAIPFSTLRNIEIKPYFTNMKMQAILEYNYIDAQKTVFLCNQRFWEKKAYYGNILGGISFTDLPIQSIIYPGDHNFCLPKETCSPDEPGVLVSSYNLGQNSTRVGDPKDYRRFELIRQNVEEVHGLPRGYLNCLIKSHKTVQWNDEPNFLGGFACSLPCQKPLFSYEMQRPEYNNRVLFAGEHISSKHGWIQGALYTGKKAANELAIQYIKT